MTLRPLAAAACLALALAARAEAGEAARPMAALAVDGHAWAAMTEGEKLRYLEGFLAGQALRQAAERLGKRPGGPPPPAAAGLPPEAPAAPDAAALAAAIESLRRERALAYPFAPTVYKTRLEDFFFYRDRRDMPLHEALAAVNAQIRGAGR